MSFFRITPRREGEKSHKMQLSEIFHIILSLRGGMSHMAQVFLALGQYMVYTPTIHQEGDMNTL